MKSIFMRGILLSSIVLTILLFACQVNQDSGLSNEAMPTGDYSTTSDTEISLQDVLIEKVRTVEDSIVVGRMIIRNAFKQQILAHRGPAFDSLSIRNGVYYPNQYNFDNCLAMIFGEQNAAKFSPPGIYDWNEQLIEKYGAIMLDKLSVLDSIDVNDIFRNHLKAVQEMTGQEGQGEWMLYFGPKDFDLFGGCDSKAMTLDLFGDAWNVNDISDLYAHELEHMVFEPIAAADPYGYAGLGITLDEGLAVYFTSLYLKQTVEEALYGEQTQLLLDREKEIFNTLSPYFYRTMEEGCPIFRHCGRTNACESLFPHMPEQLQDELCYFLGFRIIQKYVEKHGPDSWKDLYKIPIKEFYERSGYKEYITSKED